MTDTRVAVVTGGSSGIGRDLAIELSAQGIVVYAIGRRQERLAETAGQATSAAIIPIVADVTTNAGREAIVAALQETNVRLLVHLAGAMHIAGLRDMPMETWYESFEVLVHARLKVTQDLLPSMQSGSRILCVGSKSGETPRVGAAAYCVPYAASSLLVRCLQLELQPAGILVSQALPGIVPTDLLRGSMAAPENVFPDGNEYRRVGESGMWVRSDAVARFYAWLLLQADQEQFLRGELSVNDPALQPFWSRGEPIHEPPVTKQAGSER